LHWHSDKNITQSEVILFLRDLLAHLRGNVVLVWDRLNAHRSAQVQLWRAAYPRLSIEWLPPYAPELNPVEYVWGYLKGHRLANHGLCELDEVYDHARAEANEVAKHQPLLRSFVRAAELPIRLVF
jgi:transposase